MKSAFSILRYGSVISQEALLVEGANLLANPGFELGTSSGYTFSPAAAIGVVARPPTTPGEGGFVVICGQVGNMSGSVESDKVAVTAGNDYFAGFLYGMGNDEDRTTPDPSGMILAKVRWFDAGNALVSESLLFDGPVHPYRFPYVGDPVTLPVSALFRAPTGATQASLYIYAVDLDTITFTMQVTLDSLFIRPAISQRFLPLIERVSYLPSDMGRAGYGRGFSNLTYTLSERGGYTGAAFVLYGAPEYLLDWVENAIGQHVKIVYGSYGQVWEGMIYGARGHIHGVNYDVSLDTLANDVIVYYTYPYDNPASRRAQGFESIARYGRKQKIIHAEFMLPSDAENYSVRVMREMQSLRAVGTEIASSGEPDSLQIDCSGYWTTVGWMQANPGVYLSGFESQFYDTSILIATGDGITDTDADGKPDSPRSLLNVIRGYHGNLFISADYSQVQVTGRVLGPNSPDNVAPWRSGKEGFQQFIDELASIGTGTGLRLQYGVADKQQFYVRPRPTTIAYYVARDRLGNTVLRDAGNAPLDPALLLPGNFIHYTQARPAFVRPADALDDQAASYIMEYTYDAENGTGTPSSLGGEPLTQLIELVR